jgi:hypothetical protein
MSNSVAWRQNHIKLQQMFIAVRMNIMYDQGSGVCLMNTGKPSLHSRLAWASDGVLLWSNPVVASRLAGLMGAGDCWWSRLLLDLLLCCCHDASVVVTDVTDASMSEARIFILLLLGSARTNGRWRWCGERWFGSAISLWEVPTKNK